MADITLHILKPSVNNLTARVFVRAAGLDFEEVDAWGNQGSPEFIAMNPSRLTPTMQEAGLPSGAMWESCAIMAYLCNKHGLTRFYPAEPEKRAVVDNAMFFVIGSVYPLLARATYGALGFPGYPGEVLVADVDDSVKAAAASAATEALGERLEAFRTAFLSDGRFVGGADSPTIADIRLAASAEFLHMIDYDFPAWLSDYLSRVETALGDAYTEPAADVRGFLEYVRSQAAAAS
ncbi:MAG: glutathione S-transferase family protein [Gaiellales bacterium]